MVVRTGKSLPVRHGLVQFAVKLALATGAVLLGQSLSDLFVPFIASKIVRHRNGQRDRGGVLTARAAYPENADDAEDDKASKELRLAQERLTKIWNEGGGSAATSFSVSPAGADLTVERLQIADGTPPVGSVLLADPRRYFSSNGGPAALRTGRRFFVDGSRRDRANLPVRRSCHVLCMIVLQPSLNPVRMWPMTVMGEDERFASNSCDLSSQHSHAAMRCKVSLDGSWHDGWTWRQIFATLLTSFVAVRYWPSSQFVLGHRAAHARTTLVSRRAVSRNPFDVLGLSRSASYDEIRSAFRSLARTYHPDVPGTGDEDRFRAIREALEELGTPEGRERWSFTSNYASRTADSYRYNGYGYDSYESSSYSTRHRQSQSNGWEEEVRSRSTRQEEQRQRQQQKQEREAQKQAKAAANQDKFFERELRKAVASAKQRQAQRRKEWQRGVKEALNSVWQQQKEDLSLGWGALDTFKQNRKRYVDDEAKAWKERLHAERELSASQREKDGKVWVAKFAHVQEEASYRQEELGRQHSKRLRDFREGFQQRSENAEVPSAEQIQEEIDKIVLQQDEKNKHCWQKSYKSMMKRLRRSIAKEPKIWKDGFRTTLIQMGKGGQAASQKWVRKFQDTMREMGEAEKDEVAGWVDHFKNLRKPTAQEPRWNTLAQASRKLSAVSRKHVLNIIEQCRKAEVKRLNWQAWNRKQWVKKFRQAEDQAFQMEKEEKLRLAEEFWQAVKDSHVQDVPGQHCTDVSGTAEVTEVRFLETAGQGSSTDAVPQNGQTLNHAVCKRPMQDNSVLTEPLWVQYAEKAGPPFTKREHGSAVIVGSYLQAGGELAELGKECSAENHAELDCTGLDESLQSFVGGASSVSASALRRASVARHAEVNKVQAGDRFVGWLKHPVLTARQKFDLVVEVGPGDDKGAWKITDPNKKLQAGKSYEGPCKVISADEDGVIFRDADTVLNGTLNGAGPGTISGRAMQGGLKWGGFFEASHCGRLRQREHGDCSARSSVRVTDLGRERGMPTSADESGKSSFLVTLPHRSGFVSDKLVGGLADGCLMTQNPTMAILRPLLRPFPETRRHT
ncbi:dnaJ [Symbiodinium natans]|uniref:DnaJ protein n=1 Tax=Symbiodinium natans TaxID=878477 RepID=A0A812TND9_9DINO|nr:dnaJ [Symbiodinium natans]